MFITQISENTEVMELLGVHPPVHPSLESAGSMHAAWIIFKSGMHNCFGRVCKLTNCMKIQYSCNIAPKSTFANFFCTDW